VAVAPASLPVWHRRFTIHDSRDCGVTRKSSHAQHCPRERSLAVPACHGVPVTASPPAAASGTQCHWGGWQWGAPGEGGVGPSRPPRPGPSGCRGASTECWHAGSRQSRRQCLLASPCATGLPLGSALCLVIKTVSYSDPYTIWLKRRSFYIGAFLGWLLAGQGLTTRPWPALAPQASPMRADW
jgi:hypothetical protein